MNATTKNISRIRKILWADALAGGSTAIVGLLFSDFLMHLLGLPKELILLISVITGLYAVLALFLVIQKFVSIPLLGLLIYMNWAWTIVSVSLLALYAKPATTLGLTFLGLQVIVVGGLAYAEGRQLTHLKGYKSKPDDDQTQS